MSIATLFIISAPSGAGKTSLVKALLAETDSVEVCVSHTTRQRRPKERAGVDYHFTSHRQFREMVQAGEFIEHARVFDHYYGTAKSAVEAQLAQAKDVILEIDWQGARQVRRWMPQSLSVFILPPSWRTLEERLKARAQDSEQTIARRMQDASKEISHFNEFDFLVINDQFDQALADLKAILLSRRLRFEAQRQRHNKLLEQLLDGRWCDKKLF